MPDVTGLAETALYVADLSRSGSFYKSLFGFNEIYQEEGRLVALGVAKRQVLLLFRKGQSTHPTNTLGGTIPPHDGHGRLHLAFAIEPAAIDPWRARLHELQIAIESEVDCPGGGHSIYFRDCDEHLIELITPGCWAVDALP